MAEKHYGNVEPLNYKRIYELRLYNVLSGLRLPLMTVIFFTTVGVLMLMLINQKTDPSSMVDYLYHTVITFTTIGYTEGFTENITMNRLFMAVFIMVAFPLAYFYGLAVAVQVIITGNLRYNYKHWRMYSKMERISDHFIICGFNKTSREIMKHFNSRGIPYVLIESDTSLESDIISFGPDYYVFGDAHHRSVLLGVYIEQAKGLISTFDENTIDISIVVTARLIMPDKENFRIYSTATSDGEADKMRLLGANEVIVPEATTGRRLTSYALHPPSPVLSSFLHKIAYGENVDIDIVEMQIKEDSPLAEKPLKDLSLNQKYGLLAAAVHMPDGKLQVAPQGETVLCTNCSVILMGSVKGLEKFKKEIGVS